MKAFLVILACCVVYTSGVAWVFPQTCREAVTAISRDPSYLCALGGATGCHQTTTRLAPVFIGAGHYNAREQLNTWAAVYEDICGAAYVAQDTCTPANTRIYQMSYDDDNGGHSFFLACSAPVAANLQGLQPVDSHEGGCVVLQGYAGVYTLADWIEGNGDKLLTNVAKEAGEGYNFQYKKGLIPNPAGNPHYGLFRVIVGADLHNYLMELRTYASVRPTFGSCRPFWNCDVTQNRRALCASLLTAAVGHTGVAADSEAWNAATLAEDRGAPYLIKATKYDWDGTCLALGDVRQAGAIYFSKYCQDHDAYKSSCKMGLGLQPNWMASERRAGREIDEATARDFGAKEGYLPKNLHLPDDDPTYECKRRLNDDDVVA